MKKANSGLNKPLKITRSTVPQLTRAIVGLAFRTKKSRGFTASPKKSWGKTQPNTESKSALPKGRNANGYRGGRQIDHLAAFRFRRTNRAAFFCRAAHVESSSSKDSLCSSCQMTFDTSAIG